METEIVMAVDSRIGRTYLNLKTGELEKEEILTCKMRHKSGMVVALTGRHPPDLIDPFIEHMTQDSGEVYDTGLVRERLKGFAQESERAIMELNPDWEAGDLSPVTYVVGFFDNGKPVVMDYDYNANEPHEFFSGQIGVFGKNAVLDLDRREYAVVDTNNQLDLHRTFERMVVVQAQLTPDSVREPVSVLSLTASGARWVKHGKCR